LIIDLNKLFIILEYKIYKFYNLLTYIKRYN